MVTKLPIVLYSAFSLFFSALVIHLMLKKNSFLPIDNPNHRSLHNTPTPRIGGIGIMSAVAVTWVLYWPENLLLLLGLAMLLCLLSWTDDLRGLPVKIRLLAQLFCVIFSLPLLGFDWAVSLVTDLFIVLVLLWMTNLFNFMDGANGLAGGMALFGFGFYAVAADFSGAVQFAIPAAAIAAAAGGFLYSNFDPARIFMGDAGSIPLGFLAGALGLIGWNNHLWPAFFPALVFSPFIVDASVTLLKRLLRGEKIWQAHREHYYQRLILMGLGHRKTAWFEYGLMFCCGISALAVIESSFVIQIALMIFWAIVYYLLMITIDQAWKNNGQ
jgi:UDP-N-acetylmuramyl pentapeptide phosphotransferase/UDP-N-acetylglucosamine-1-phosphate transferase